MDNFNIQDLMNPDGIAEQEAKELLGHETCVRKVSDDSGVITYRIYAQYYPDSILTIKGEDINFQNALRKAKEKIDMYKRRYL